MSMDECGHENIHLATCYRTNIIQKEFIGTREPSGRKQERGSLQCDGSNFKYLGLTHESKRNNSRVNVARLVTYPYLAVHDPT